MWTVYNIPDDSALTIDDLRGYRAQPVAYVETYNVSVHGIRIGIVNANGNLYTRDEVIWME